MLALTTIEGECLDTPVLLGENHLRTDVRKTAPTTTPSGTTKASMGNPSGALDTANFGRITSAQDGRVILLGIKYLF